MTSIAEEYHRLFGTTITLPPTVRAGSSGPDVVRWQKIIGVSADGKFGPATEQATRTWQLQHHLVADGVVGQVTWGAALGMASGSKPPKQPLDPNNIHVRAKHAVDSIGLTPNESAFVRSVAWHETNDGLGWGSVPPPDGGAGSFNMGAVTTSNPGPLDFRHEDSRNDDGQLVTYTTWFKGYPSFEEGMRGLADQVLKPNVRAALKKGDFPGAVAAMYANHYFLGIHPRNTPEGNAANIADYTRAVNSAFGTISSFTHESIKKGFLIAVGTWLGLGTGLLVGVVAYNRLNKS